MRLQAAVRAYTIPRAALEAIIDGVEMDLDRVAYETADDLYPYCYRVASAVGLACIEIFGYTDPRARQYAVNLGQALQLTNIIRDVGADARTGRVYIPQEDLRAFDVTVDDLRAARYTEPFRRLMAYQAARARQFYRLAWESFPAADARSLLAAEIMGRIYLALLEEIEARRFRVFDAPVTVPGGKKLAIAVGCWIAARVGRAAGVTSCGIGDRVVAAHHVPCGECHYCRRGSASMCPAFKASNLDPGGFAECVRVPAPNVRHAMFRLPRHVTDEAASFVEPLACCLRSVQRARVEPGDTVVVVGLGSIGCLFVQLLRHAGAAVVGCDPIAERAASGRRLGATAAAPAEAAAAAQRAPSP